MVAAGAGSRTWLGSSLESSASRRQMRPRVQRLLAEHAGHARIVVVRSRRAAADWLLATTAASECCWPWMPRQRCHQLAGGLLGSVSGGPADLTCTRHFLMGTAIPLARP